MGINPVRLRGNWDEGWALDMHVVSIEAVGLDTFNTTRTKIGELTYQLKYRNVNTIEEIVELAKIFFDKWDKLGEVDVIMPAPPSKIRHIQPVFGIAYSIAEKYDIPYRDDVLLKSSEAESKDMKKRKKLLSGTITVLEEAAKAQNILLIDDLYSTGATLRECVERLQQDYLAKNVYVVTMTMNRTR